MVFGDKSAVWRGRAMDTPEGEPDFEFTLRIGDYKS